MKYEELEVKAAQLSFEERDAQLVSLVNDTRFPAVVRLIRDQMELVCAEKCQVRFAGSHGALAHGAGAEYFGRELLAKVRACAQPAKKRGGATKPPEEA